MWTIIWAPDSDDDGWSDDDDNCPDTYNPDQTGDDGDGWGAACDCDDPDAGVNPGATELCNRIDDNCNRSVDEGFDQDNYGYALWW